MMGGVPSGGGASSDERHPLGLWDVGGGVLHDRTICETPWATTSGATQNNPPAIIDASIAVLKMWYMIIVS
jgi:hypothetical protein